jgi:transposase
MPARKGPKKVNRYSVELKRTAVRLTEAPGARVKDVAESLDIHPFMLSGWRKLAREGLLVKQPAAKARAKSKRKRAPSMVEMSKYAQLKRELEALRKEHEFLKKFDRFRAQLKAKGSRSSRGSGSGSDSK